MTIAIGYQLTFASIRGSSLRSGYANPGDAPRNFAHRGADPPPPARKWRALPRNRAGGIAPIDRFVPFPGAGHCRSDRSGMAEAEIRSRPIHRVDDHGRSGRESRMIERGHHRRRKKRKHALQTHACIEDARVRPDARRTA